MSESVVGNLRVKLFVSCLKDGADAAPAELLMSWAVKNTGCGELDSMATAEYLVRTFSDRGWTLDQIAQTSLADFAAVLGGGPPPPEMPEVDLMLNQVRYRGMCHSVTADGALLVSKLVESYPHAFAASSIFTKPSRVKDSLPDALKALMIAETGKGYRLTLG